MRIGLIRHFKVKHSFPKKALVSKAEVLEWFNNYELAELEIKEVDLAGIDWKRCYSSPMNRALGTANQIYKGEIIQIVELKELEILHQLPNGIKLPFLVWGTLVRIKSFLSNKDTDEFNNKIIAFVDHLLSKNESDILIVSHWFVMRVIRKELIKRGMTGGRFKSDEYGVLYIYEKQIPPLI